MKARHLLILMAVFGLVSCAKYKEHAEVDIRIGYEVNGKPLISDTLCYTNEVGNSFMVTEIQWFVSKMELQNEHDEWISLEHREVDNLFPYSIDRIFYIDTDIPKSQTLLMAPIPVGHYNALRFIFGLDEEYNLSGLYSDPPESNMFWPAPLGGGYHYMKLNGKFVDTEGRLAPLAIHLGIGQNDECTEFYHNHFVVELPLDFTVSESSENQLDLTMVVDNWFRNPNAIDFNEFGSGIMQNQTAQRLFNENGGDVFRIGKPNENNTVMKNDHGLAEKFRNAMQKAAPKPHFWRWKNVKERFQDLKISNLTSSNASHFKIS